MNLIIDIGNSRLKYGCFDHQRRLTAVGCGEESLFELLETIKDEKCDLFISASGELKESFLNQLSAYDKSITMIHRGMHWPIRIDYQTPYTLGYDRIANCVGAIRIADDSSDVLIIDIGSAITYNYVIDTNNFVGGNISLGVGMRFRALYEFTAHLPLLEPIPEYAPIGQSTNEAIIAGVMEGICYELEGVVRAFYRNHPAGKVIVTGGGYEVLRSHLHFIHHYESHLGLIGLNEIFCLKQNHKLE